jgi:hypothetical protein
MRMLGDVLPYVRYVKCCEDSCAHAEQMRPSSDAEHMNPCVIVS